MNFLENIKRLSFRHKNNKLKYYILNYLRLCLPATIFRWWLKKKFAYINKVDADYVQLRVDYYNRLSGDHFNGFKPKSFADIKTNWRNTKKIYHTHLSTEYRDLPAFRQKIETNSVAIKTLRKTAKKDAYFFDIYQYLRYFPDNRIITPLFGDVICVPETPVLTKSRPIGDDNQNSVLLKLNKIRHFLFVKDTNRFESKRNRLVWRGEANWKNRIRLLEQYIDHPLCNIGQINSDQNPQFVRPRLTIEEHLKYKFILCLEGNDVATNLKWVMSSNSIAVMPRPKYETWFMEGTLIPDYHYILIKDDYSDLEERLRYYIEHTDEALKIIENAHRHIAQFQNERQEDLIALMVLRKYFEKTRQQ